METINLRNPICASGGISGLAARIGWGAGKRKYYIEKEKTEWLKAQKKDVKIDLPEIREKNKIGALNNWFG